jgi:hypothetical protein
MHYFRVSKSIEESNYLIILLKSFLMKAEFELKAPPTGKMLFKLTILGCVLLGGAYGFIVLMNSALAAIK